MKTNIHLSAEAIAINRFGLGVHLNQSTPSIPPKKWLLSQLNQYQVKPKAWQNQRNSEDIVGSSSNMQMQSMSKSDKQAARKVMRKKIRNDYNQSIKARALSALNTNTPFIERLVHFWANHFAISIQKPAVTALAGAYELEAIRPYVLGSFKDMLFAVEKHPAMLLFLDQARSMGPNSQAATRRNKRKPNKKAGLNENLAREILELHTLGVRSGYNQQDVTEFAKALTGWSVANKNNSKQPFTAGANGFAYRPQIHEPGTRTILGKLYAQAGQTQAETVLNDLATNPATAKHIATKLARHFTSDQPPQTLIDTLSKAFQKSGGNLKEVYIALINAPEVWQAIDTKFKTPWEWVISSLRGLGQQGLNKIKVAQVMKQLSQPVWKPGSPAGYDDIAATWASPNALMRRVELAQRYSASLGRRLDARNLANQLLLGNVSTETLTQIQRAESANTALALLLVCPEFLRR
ncbi:MAG: DUF1800 family protein [Methylophilaceae bacterium]